MTLVDRAILAGPTLEAARALLGMLLVRDGPTGPAEVDAEPESHSEPGRAPADEGPRSDAGSALTRRVGRIVEVEAYIGPEDEASHARFGRTGRSSVMFGPPGIAYVYLVYGMYDALNVVTEPTGRAAAVLVRAVEPLEGIDAMRAARLDHAATRRRRPPLRGAAAARGNAGVTDRPGWLEDERLRLARLPIARLASGPGVLAAAFGIDRSCSGLDLCDPASPLRLEAAPGGSVFGVATGPRVGVGYAGEPWRSAPWRFAIADHPSVSRPAPFAVAHPASSTTASASLSPVVVSDRQA